jgi:anti-sigma factor ChrR (cupin superfamily)
MEHPTDETLAAFALGLLAAPDHTRVATHLDACPGCERGAAGYREMSEILRLWRDAPSDLMTTAQEGVTQRIRLQGLLEGLLADPDLRRQAQADPHGLLNTRGITATPELLAAFRELDPSPARFPHELDERVTKLRRLLEWFPGAPPPLSP